MASDRLNGSGDGSPFDWGFAAQLYISITESITSVALAAACAALHCGL